mgnify:CR=1 FL=1
MHPKLGADGKGSFPHADQAEMARLDAVLVLAHAGARRTHGLDDATILRFVASHPDLVDAIHAAAADYAAIREEFAELLDLDDAVGGRQLQPACGEVAPADLSARCVDGPDPQG